MKVLGCGAVAVLKLTIMANRVEPEGRETVVYEKREEGGFGISVPRRVGKDIKSGDTLVALCVPLCNLSLSHETLVLAKREGGRTEVIFTQGHYWTEIWNGMRTI